MIGKLLKRNINLVSPKLKKIKNKKFVLMFIKHYNKSKLITDGTNSRHTLNFNKIYKIIDFFIKKKKIVVILGNDFDKSIPILKKKYNKNNNIIFFKEISLEQSIYDQLFVHYYSSLSIGSDSGAFVMSHYLKKKLILFDALKDKNLSYQRFKNIKMLYKKIIYDGKKENLSTTNLNMISKINNKFLIKENSFAEIKKELEKIKYKL